MQQGAALRLPPTRSGAVKRRLCDVGDPDRDVVHDRKVPAGSSAAADAPRRPLRVRPGLAFEQWLKAIQASKLRKNDRETEPAFAIRYRPVIDRMSGAAGAEIILGPLSRNDVNSDANRGLKKRLPPGMSSAAKAYPNLKFKSGHLLNACLGGAGTDSRNLTILTDICNGAMNKPDGQVKVIPAELEKYYKEFFKAGYTVEQMHDFSVGVLVRVSVSGTKWGRFAPDHYIANRVHYEAKVVREPRQLPANVNQGECRKILNKIHEIVNRIDGVQIENPKPTA